MSGVLSKQEISEYIKNIVIPGFIPLVDKNLKSAIWNNDDSLIIATNKLARSVGFIDYKHMQEEELSIRRLLKYATVDAFIKQFPILKSITEKLHLTSEKKMIGLEVIRSMNDIKEQVLQDGTPINAILIHPFVNIHETPILFKYVPIFHPSGQIIAVQSFLSDFNMFGVFDYLSGSDKKTLEIPRMIMDDRELPLNLTPRQHEIVFLLVIGLTQRQISALLHISRGTVARLVSNTICPKFGINDSNSIVLIEKAKQMNIHHYIPPSLCKPWVLILK